MRGLGGDANMCDLQTDTHTDTRTQPFIVKDGYMIYHFKSINTYTFNIYVCCDKQVFLLQSQALKS